jgi:hypothetical protein
MKTKKNYHRTFTSALIFLSTVLLGSTGIFAINSLDDTKSTANPVNQLTATKWDYVIEQVKRIGNDLNDLNVRFGSLTNTISTINTTINSLTTNINNIVNSQWITAGNNIHYNKGRVGIGTDNPSVSLHVNGNIIASTPTADNHVATKAYVDSKTTTQSTEISVEKLININQSNPYY